jgi:hypothetical protein
MLFHTGLGFSLLLNKKEVNSGAKGQHVKPASPKRFTSKIVN